MVSAFEHIVKRDDWESYESRIEPNTYHLLEILDGNQNVQRAEKPSTQNSSLSTQNSELRTQNSKFVTHNSSKATFFCLGWIAERYPHLIKEIHSRGHEIANHGYDHRMITSISPKEFREDIRKSKVMLENLIGERVIGYRAPSYSITRKTLWALEILLEEGFFYDSSIFPIHHDRYGIPDAPRYPFYIEFNGGKIHSQFKKPKYLYEISRSKAVSGKHPNRNRPDPLPFTLQPPPRTSHPAPWTLNPIPCNFLIEFPISTLRVLGQNLPIAGGGYLRLFPFKFVQWALRKIKKKGTLPFVFYIHPWELDPEQPKIHVLSPMSRFRQYFNLDKTECRLKRLLRGFYFTSFRKALISHTNDGLKI
ncbi:MAG: XrtA system polysaccharide deacetylase [Candidatus Hodarchaeota archaeon]